MVCTEQFHQKAYLFPVTWSEQYATNLDRMCPSSVLSSFLAVVTTLLLAANNATNVASLAVPYNNNPTDKVVWLYAVSNLQKNLLSKLSDFQYQNKSSLLHPLTIVCHVFLFQQDYCKTNQMTLLKLSDVIMPSSRKNWLTFGGDLFPDTDSGSLFRFSQHCRIGHFRRFIRIFHTVTGWF